MQDEKATYQIWVDRDNKIASFNKTSNSVLESFEDDNSIQAFLTKLIEQWYVFQ